MQATLKDARRLRFDARMLGGALVYGAVALTVADATIHALVIGEHFAEWWGYGAFFSVLVAAQLLYAVALFRYPQRLSVCLAGVTGSLALIALYGVTRTWGMPLGPHAGHAEEPGGLGLVSKAVELALLTGLLALAWRSTRRWSEPGAASERGRMLSPVAKLGVGVAAILVLLFVGYRFSSGVDLGRQGGTVSATDAASCERRACDVHLTATLATQRYAERIGVWDQVSIRNRSAQAFVITATTHAGTVKQLTLEDRLFLQVDGTLYPAAGSPVNVTTHHNTYLVFFPRYDMQGAPIFERQKGQFELVVKDVDGADAPARALTFRYPLPPTQGSGLPLTQALMVVGAAMAALLFACTPCLVGSLAVGSLATGSAVGAPRPEELAKAKRAMLRQVIGYLIGLVAIYLGVAVAVNVLKLRMEDLRPLELIGGALLVLVGLSLLRGTRVGVRLVSELSWPLHRVLPGRFKGGPALEGTLGPTSSSAMGASLAMVCSVAGAPTLSTAVLLPLLVYAGLSHPLWAFLVLLMYLVVCAVPFFFVAAGWGEIVLRASLRWRTALLTASAVLVIALGLLLLVSPSAVADAVSAPARLALAPLRWLP